MGRILQIVILFYSLARKYTDKAIAAAGGGGSGGSVHWQDYVDYYSDLPANPQEGDCYTVRYAGSNSAALDGTGYVYGIDSSGVGQWVPFSSRQPLIASLDDGTLTLEMDANGLMSVAVENSTLSINY